MTKRPDDLDRLKRLGEVFSKAANRGLVAENHREKLVSALIKCVEAFGTRIKVVDNGPKRLDGLQHPDKRVSEALNSEYDVRRLVCEELKSREIASADDE